MFAYFPEFVTEELEPQPPGSVCWSRCTVSVGGGRREGSGTSWTPAGSSYPGVRLGGQSKGFRSFTTYLVKFNLFKSSLLIFRKAL